jgi:hypothetical protein
LISDQPLRLRILMLNTSEGRHDPGSHHPRRHSAARNSSCGASERPPLSLGIVSWATIGTGSFLLKAK